MIKFKSENVDGIETQWEFETAQEIEDVWRSEDCDLPANDDFCYDILIDDEPLGNEIIFIELLNFLTGKDLDLEP